MPTLWQCDLQFAPYESSFPPGLKTRRAQDWLSLIQEQKNRYGLPQIFKVTRRFLEAAPRSSGIETGLVLPYDITNIR